MAAAGAKENLVIFHQSIQSIFDGWTGLQLAVRQGFGGPHSLEKARWMVDAVHNWFLENDGIEPYELEDFLADILDHEFDTIAEDDSLTEIATDICTNFNLCNTGHHQTVLDKIKQTPAARVGECVADATEDMDEDDDDVQDANVQALLGGIRLGHQSHDQQGSISQQNSSEITGPSSLAATSSGATEAGSSSRSSPNSRQETAEEEDGWTVVRKSKKK